MKTIYAMLAALSLTGCAMSIKTDVLPTPNFDNLETVVEEQEKPVLDSISEAILNGVDYNTPDEKRLPLLEKTIHFGYTVLVGSDYSGIKETRTKMAVTNNTKYCDVWEVSDAEESDKHAKAFKKLLRSIADGSEKGQLEFYGSNKGKDAVLLRQGDEMYLAVGKEGLKLRDLWYFGSFDNCEAELFEGFFIEPKNKDVLRAIGKVYTEKP
ncbi:hypothetical protein GOV03_03920 [Candidatus Woesearchaeota archaeon]|nr:hypothetical protein [Candidatus Woesearchaeota archaeon]